MNASLSTREPIKATKDLDAATNPHLVEEIVEISLSDILRQIA